MSVLRLLANAVSATARLGTYIIPIDSPLRDPRLAIYFAASIIVLHSTFHILGNSVFSGADPKKLKQRCWILTTTNALVMTVVSIPYLLDLFLSGFDLHALKPRTECLAQPMSCFFVAYLLSDLGLGSLYYRHLINLSSGWIHHSVYTLLFAFWVHKGWSHIAIMACVFELPTLVMGIASLHPPLRSNSAFTGTFFATRVFFHLGLILAMVTEHGRATPGIDGSLGPAISVIVTYPMHLWWGYKCLMSVRRRMHKRKLESRKIREQRAAEAGAAAQYFASAGQLVNGLPDPSISSAVNTPATTPASSPVLSAADKKQRSAFERAAAVAGSPINLVLGRRRKDSDVNEKPLLLGESVTSGTAGHTFAQPFTNSVRPEGAKDGDREPFLPIRSEAETRDRARRLVADAIRKAWMRQPESWRKQLENEMQALPPVSGNGTSTPINDSVQPSRRASGSGEASGDEDAIEGEDINEAMPDDVGISSALATANGEQIRSRAQRGKAAARRAFVRAINRAIKGPTPKNLEMDGPEGSPTAPIESQAGVMTPLGAMTDTDAIPSIGEEAVASGEERDLGLTLPGTLPGLDNVSDEEEAAKMVQEARRQHRLLQMLVRISGVSLPPDMLGQEYSVREFPVERNNDVSRQRRFLDQIRRRMEIANRDVVVFD